MVPPERVNEVRAALDSEDGEDEVVGFAMDDEEEVQMIGTQSFDTMGSGGFSMGGGRAVPVVNSYQRLPGLDPTDGFTLF